MANVLTAVVPKLLAQGLLALREMAVMPLLVNRNYEALAGERGSTIDVPIPSAIAAVEVAPANVPPTTADIAPTSVPVALDQWWEAPFYLTDKEQLEVMNGLLPMQASEAIKVLANKIDKSILGLYTKFHGFQGTENAGAFITPFTDTSGNPTDARDATALRKILNKQLAPVDDRHVVMNPDVEAAALNIRAFQDASWTGSPMAIIEGQLNRKLGFNWWMDQNILTHVAGTAAGEADVTVNGAHAAGVKVVSMTEAAGNHTLVVGDILTIAGHSQTYVVTAAATLDAAENVSIEPGLQVALSGGEAVDVKPSHAVNLAFHRDAIAFATRPLVAHGAALGVINQNIVDPISGLTLRLEVTHEHKRLRFSYDVLWGAAVVRREFGARLASPA